MSAVARFVVLEGGDATGKSTQMHHLATRLRDAGHDVVETFEPGATRLGARLRTLLLDEDGPLDPIAEALLMAADRAEHVAEVVRPALQRGAWVLSDRFVPSSLAYQGVGRGLGVGEVGQLNELATAGLEPDLVVVLDLAPEVARERLGMSRDRMEGENDAFALAVHEAYRDLARSRGWSIVDASPDVDAVATAIWAVVEEHLAP
ncbi:MAG: dTMP kinase [Acidimicrobiia bacterium]|nr:dTMP kinase [Acidimicrobiia bacterium]